MGSSARRRRFSAEERTSRPADGARPARTVSPFGGGGGGARGRRELTVALTTFRFSSY